MQKKKKKLYQLFTADVHSDWSLCHSEHHPNLHLLYYAFDVTMFGTEREKPRYLIQGVKLTSTRQKSFYHRKHL